MDYFRRDNIYEDDENMLAENTSQVETFNQSISKKVIESTTIF